MAINKRKVLDNARKLAQKGAKQKALKEYNLLVQADPRDTKLLLEIGDVYRRWGQAEEAIAQYTRVANQYKQDGFDARAVAVLKQILNLDPKRYVSHVALAELYQRMGLDSDAIGALQTAADGYYREGRRREALELLRKMAALDPANTTSRLKVADLLRQEGMEDDAVAEYEEVVRELKRQGAGENVCVVQERLLELRVDHVPTLVSLARNLSDLGRPERAERFALRALELAKEPDHFELLAGIYKSLGNEARLAAVTRELAAFYKTRGDEDRAREVLQRLPPEAMTPLSAKIGGDRSELDESDVSEDELLEDEDFLVSDASDQADLLELDEEQAIQRDTGAAAGAAQAELPDGDPEQLLAEASVYLRYGKRTQAIASLKSALRQRPEHRGILDKLGEAYAEEGQNDDAIGCWQRAAELAREAGDAEGFAILRDRIGALDPVAASEIEPMTEDGGHAARIGEDLAADLPDANAKTFSKTTEPGDEFDLSIDVSESGELDPADADESASGFDLDDSRSGRDDAEDSDASTTDRHSIDLDSGIEVEVDLDGDDRDLFGKSASTVGDEIEIDLDGSSEPVAPAAAAGRGAAKQKSASSQFGQSTTSAAQIKEDLEEAEFYIQQGLANEAEAIFRRVLAAAPNHPTALLKLGELAAQRGDDPGMVTDPGVDLSAASFDAGLSGGTTEITFDDENDDETDDASGRDSGSPDVSADGLEFELDLDDDSIGSEDDTAEIPSKASDGLEPSEDLQAILAEAEAGVAGPDGSDLDASDAGLPTGRAGEDATEVEEPTDPGHGAARPRFAPEPVQAEPDPHDGLVDDTLPIPGPAARKRGGARGDESPMYARGAGGGEANFDLAAELADVFGDDEPATGREAIAARSTVEDGFESLFADFKKGVSASLDEGDYDTRFDLGIAYREMGLFNDALSEFTVCLGSPSRKLECLHMMALCSMELGRNRDAINHLEQALSGGDLPVVQMTALRFDLGRVQRRAGDRAAARHAFAAVQQADPRFPGLAAEMTALEAAGDEPEAELELDSSRQDFESFDDLMRDDSEAAAPEPAAPAETFESFDDVITDAEASDSEPFRSAGPSPAPVAEHEIEPEAVVEPDEAPTDPGTSRPGRRKKKISFV